MSNADVARANLRLAVRTRLIRAAILRNIREQDTGLASRTLCAEHIESPDRALASMRVRDLLTASRGVGDWYARQLERTAGVSGDRQVGRLTDRERDAISAALREPRPCEDTTHAHAYTGQVAA